MNAFLTEKTFKKGVAAYLERFKYSNTKQEDLWEELTKAALIDHTLDTDLTVETIMNTWTLKKGYPVVDMKREGDQLVSSQRWFLLNPENTIQNTEEYKNTSWYVPITYTCEKEQDFNFEKRPQWLKSVEKPCNNLICYYF